MAVDLDDALGRQDDPGEDLEQRALARAVGADDAQRLALADLERGVAQGPEVALGAALRAAHDVWRRVGFLPRRRLYLTPRSSALMAISLPAHRRRAHSTFANWGSTRLNSRIASASRTSGPERHRGQAHPVRRRAVVDDVPVAAEDVGERVELVPERDQRVGAGDLLDILEAVQRRRQVEPEAQGVAGDVADVAVEDVDRRGARWRSPARTASWTAATTGMSTQPRGDPVGVDEDHHAHQRDEPERERDHARRARGQRHDELREVDLLDQPFRARRPS